MQRIRKEVFDVRGEDFDFLDMESRIRRFCIKYNIAEKTEPALQACILMLDKVMADYFPMTVRITHSEMSDETALDFMVEGLQASPLKEGENASLERLRSLCQEIVEEPTTRGFRVKLKI